MEFLQRLFSKPPEILAEFELEKTPEDIAVIHEVQELVDEMAAKYGGAPKQLPLENIHLLKPGAVFELTQGKLRVGIHRSLSLRIGVEKRPSRIPFCGTLAHELFHAQGFKSFYIRPDGKGTLYRSGIQTVDQKDPSAELGDEKMYFSQLEEAIVTECARQLVETLGQQGFFGEEEEAMRTLRNLANAHQRRLGWTQQQMQEFAEEVKYVEDPIRALETIKVAYPSEEKRSAYAAGLIEGMKNRGAVEMKERYFERKKFYRLLDELIEKSQGAYTQRSEIFAEFAKAHFSGRYLPLARIVEGILGEGAFRRIANDFSETPGKKK
ncbi:MAG: hypothetical protein AAB463_01030 [Patescibacteria group bacterium]